MNILENLKDYLLPFLISIFTLYLSNFFEKKKQIKKEETIRNILIELNKDRNLVEKNKYKKYQTAYLSNEISDIEKNCSELILVLDDLKLKYNFFIYLKKLFYISK